MVLTDLEIAQASIELVGGFVCAMLAVIIMINGHQKRSMKLITQMLFTTALIFLSEAAAYIYRGNTGPFSLIMTRLSNFAVFFLNFLLARVSLEYIYSILQEKQAATSGKYRKIVTCGFYVAVGILVVNLFTGIMYYFDSSNYYHRSWGWYLYTLDSMICLCFSCVLVIRHHKFLPRTTQFSLLLFELFPLIAIVVQSLYYGISITNIGIGISVVLILITYLIDWNRSEEDEKAISQLRRSYETIILFVIMVISISASIISCIISIRRISSDISISNDQVISHIVSDRIENVFLRPITVAETMSKDNVMQEYMQRSGGDSPESVEDEMAAYLDSIRTGFDYYMVYAVNERSKAYYTYDGIVKFVDPENDPADLWYRDFVTSGEEYKLEVDTDEANHWDLSVFVNVRIPDQDGSLLGVCGIGLEMQALQEQLAKFEEQYQIKITLIDHTGLIQIDSDNLKIEQEYLPISGLDHIGSQEFYHEETVSTSRMVKRMDDLGWYLVIEDLTPGKINISQILLPNVAIFLVGLFMLAVAFCVIMIRDRKISTELIEKRRTSLSDDMTGLLNRRAYDFDCDKIENSGTAHDYIYVSIDLNGLKTTNDTLGHQAGDELILAAAECLTQSLGKYGSVYRVGGDEFMALLTCTREQLEAALTDLDRISSNWNGKLVHYVATAVGSVIGSEHPDATLSEMLHLADKKMYENKDRYYRITGLNRRK